MKEEDFQHSVKIVKITQVLWAALTIQMRLRSQGKVDFSIERKLREADKV
jgi:hypothetical protein